jgi:iron complex transport system ATP-binding protein
VTALSGTGLGLGYPGRVVARDLDVAIPERSFTVVVGPNACGKSTLLKTLARVVRPLAGTVRLDGRPLGSWAPKEVARRMAFMTQSAVAPPGVTVAELVARGRYPHQRFLRRWSAEDEAVTRAAMARVGVADLADRGMGELSGGQRQRAWLALALAQQTPILLLDEPTTYLDLRHQLDVLDLCADLHADGEHTVVAVLHDLNQACRYADHLIVMAPGAGIVATGDPAEVMTEALVRQVFDLEATVAEDPQTGTPWVVPRRRPRWPAASPGAVVAAVPEYP